MKQRILIRYGTPGSNEFQHFVKKDCRHCWSHHHCWDCDDYGKCCRCDGTGVYLPEAWVRLIPWTFGGFQFHCPAEKLYELPEGYAVKYEGRIVHGLKAHLLPEECRMWLELFFDTKRFFRCLGSNGYYGEQSIKRPLVSIGTFVHMLRFDRWHLLNAILPFRVYWWLRCRWESAFRDEMPF